MNAVPRMRLIVRLESGEEREFGPFALGETVDVTQDDFDVSVSETAPALTSGEIDLVNPRTTALSGMINGLLDFGRNSSIADLPK